MNVIKGKRAIGIFDILGFRELMRSAKIALLPEILNKTLSIAKTTLVSDSVLGSIVFSDTIVFYGIEGKGFLDEALIVISASNLLNIAAMNGIALRGALTYGEIYIDREKEHIIGPAIVRGYDLEQSQDWMGAFVDSEFQDRFVEGNKTSPPALHNNLLTYHVPLKSGFRIPYKCIGWMHRCEMTRDRLWKLFFGDSDCDVKHTHEVYRKYQNTLAFLEHCKKEYPEDFDHKYYLKISG